MAVYLLGAQRIFAASCGARNFRRGGAFCGGGVVALELRARADYAQGFVARRDVGLRDALSDMVRRAFQPTVPPHRERDMDVARLRVGEPRAFYGCAVVAGDSQRFSLPRVRIVRRGSCGCGTFINRARKSLMERDEAGEQLAYHIIATARATKRPEDLEAGIDALYRSFRTKPQAKQLVELLRYARETNDLALMSELVTYLSPSSYRKIPADGGASRDEK